MITTKEMELSEDKVYTENDELTEKADHVFCECANVVQESLDSPMHIMCSITNLAMKYKDDVEALSAIREWINQLISDFRIENWKADLFEDDVDDGYYLKECIADILENVENILFLEFVKTK